MWRGGWVGSIHNAIGPRLANTTVKLEIPEFVKFFNEKTISGPCRKVTSVFREKQYLFANQLATKNSHTLAGNI